MACCFSLSKLSRLILTRARRPSVFVRGRVACCNLRVSRIAHIGLREREREEWLGLKQILH